MTKKQEMMLEFIKQYIIVHGFPPSFDDVAKGLGLKSRSNVHRIVHRLKREGKISLKAKKFRSIQIIDRTAERVSAL